MKLRDRSENLHKCAMRHAKKCGSKSKYKKKLTPSIKNIYDINKNYKKTNLQNIPLKTHYSCPLKPLIIRCSRIDYDPRYLYPDLNIGLDESDGPLSIVDNFISRVSNKSQHSANQTRTSKAQFMNCLHLLSICFNKGTENVHMPEDCMCIQPCSVRIKALEMNPVSPKSAQHGQHIYKPNSFSMPCYPTGKLMRIDLTSNLGRMLFTQKMSSPENCNYYSTTYNTEKYCDYKSKKVYRESSRKWPCTYVCPASHCAAWPWDYSKCIKSCHNEKDQKLKNCYSVLNTVEYDCKKHQLEGGVYEKFFKIPKLQLHKVIVNVSKNVSFVNLNEIIKSEKNPEAKDTINKLSSMRLCVSAMENNQVNLSSSLTPPVTPLSD